MKDEINLAKASLMMTIRNFLWGMLFGVPVALFMTILFYVVENYYIESFVSVCLSVVASYFAWKFAIKGYMQDFYIKTKMVTSVTKVLSIIIICFSLLSLVLIVLGYKEAAKLQIKAGYDITEYSYLIVSIIALIVSSAFEILIVNNPMKKLLLTFSNDLDIDTDEDEDEN